MSKLIASSSGPAIDSTSRVTLHFSVLLESGEEVDTTRRGKPASFVVGDGNLLPGFESALMGMHSGDDAQLKLPPAEAFGERIDANVQRIPKDRFVGELGAGIELEPGVMLSFSAPDGELPGVVTRVLEQSVEVDFNHPLAGRTIVFDVSVLEVESVPGADRS